MSSGGGFAVEAFVSVKESWKDERSVVSGKERPHQQGSSLAVKSCLQRLGDEGNAEGSVRSLWID